MDFTYEGEEGGTVTDHVSDPESDGDYVNEEEEEEEEHEEDDGAEPEEVVREEEATEGAESRFIVMSDETAITTTAGVTAAVTVDPATPSTQATIVDEPLPDYVIQQEIAYNAGRAYHEVQG